jgi:D-alanyl-D-alanine carboxypeptidase
MIAAAALAVAAASLETRVDALAAQAGFNGVVLIARGDRVLLEKGYGTVEPGGSARHDPKATWRLASITKQVAATLLVARQPDALDRSAGTSGATLRQLLTHHSGLANPDATPATGDGFPSFYLTAGDKLPYCLSRPAVPGSPFSYNNCDYIVAAKAGGGIARWPAGMRMARPGEYGVAGYIKSRREPPFSLASFGAAGGLVGTAQAVFRFDRALMTGTLIGERARAELWRGDPQQGYQAIGQWVFPAQLKGCAGPTRIVQRDGEIGGVQARNYMLPDIDAVVILFTNRSSDDFDFGQVWQASGFGHAMLSAAACP